MEWACRFVFENELFHGIGDVSVCVSSSNGKNGSRDILLLEKGLGTGRIGEVPPTRKEGTEIDLNELAASPTVCLLHFKNVESLETVVAKLEIIKNNLKAGHKSRR